MKCGGMIWLPPRQQRAFRLLRFEFSCKNPARVSEDLLNTHFAPKRLDLTVIHRPRSILALRRRRFLRVDVVDVDNGAEAEKLEGDGKRLAGPLLGAQDVFWPRGREMVCS